MLAPFRVNTRSTLRWRVALLGITVSFMLVALYQANGQAAPAGNPHNSGGIRVPPGMDEVAFCMKCHTSGCTMPHPEHVGMGWPAQGRANLPGGVVSCSSCHTPGFHRRVDAFVAADQKTLCSVCHYGPHALPDAHSFGSPCGACHTAPRSQLALGHPAASNLTGNIDPQCLRCHFDGAITHPVGIKNTKKPAPDLPLGKDGTITCVTCHFGHNDQNRNGQLLRANNRHGGLCLKCHDDL